MSDCGNEKHYISYKIALAAEPCMCICNQLVTIGAGRQLNMQ